MFCRFLGYRPPYKQGRLAIDRSRFSRQLFHDNVGSFYENIGDANWLLLPQKNTKWGGDKMVAKFHFHIKFGLNCGILINISVKYVPKNPIDSTPALVEIRARQQWWSSLLTHICVTRSHKLIKTFGKIAYQWQEYRLFYLVISEYLSSLFQSIICQIMEISVVPIID